ncbi:hypothetical protein [Streptomyces sp. NPDC058751]|uniref:hypothetical protein n=1 Tax=Streptomyces sp. NPDC058751 TaxID=3346623 RepID=UPI003697858C
MTVTPSVPVLRGSGGAVLRHDGAALTLRRAEDEIRIPLEAVQDVVTSGRTVTVELRMPQGAQAVVHRVEGVSEAAAGMFATAVNAAVARLPESDPSLDGAALVTTRSLADPHAPGVRGRFLATGLLMAVFSPGLAALVAGSVIVVVRGRPLGLLVILVLGVVGLLLNAVCVALTAQAKNMWHLPRRGITVQAGFTSRGKTTRVYEYTDQHGETHTFNTSRGTTHVEIAYDPRHPHIAVGVFPVVVRLLMTLATLLSWCAAIAWFALMIFAAIDGV